MSDFVVLEQRVSTVEKSLRRIDTKLDLAIEQDHERLTRLEDVLAEFIRENKAFMRENREGFAQLRQEIAASEKRMAEQQQRLTEQQQRSDAQWTKWQKEMTQSREELGRLSHRLGTLVEDLVAPSLPRILRELVHCPDETAVMVNVRLRRRHPLQRGQMLEIDALADCDNYVLINETKSQLTPEKVKAFVAKFPTIRDYFPEYQHHTIIGGVSSLFVEDSLIDYASRQGLLVLGTSEGLMAIQNAPGFTWRAF
jgi:hypothetical protein